MWSNSGPHFRGPYLDPKMGSAMGEFRCCPQMFCTQICDPAAWTWMSTHTFFSLCVPRPLATVKVSLSQPCFEHFFRPCFTGHDEAGLLAFEALRGSPRPARGQASDAKRNGTRTKRGSRRLESIIHVKTEWAETKKRWRWSPAKISIAFMKACNPKWGKCPVWDLNFKAHADFRPSICSVSLAK